MKLMVFLLFQFCYREKETRKILKDIGIEMNSRVFTSDPHTVPAKFFPVKLTPPPSTSNSGEPNREDPVYSTVSFETEQNERQLYEEPIATKPTVPPPPPPPPTSTSPTVRVEKEKVYYSKVASESAVSESCDRPQILVNQNFKTPSVNSSAGSFLSSSEHCAMLRASLRKTGRDLSV